MSDIGTLDVNYRNLRAKRIANNCQIIERINNSPIKRMFFGFTSP